MSLDKVNDYFLREFAKLAGVRMYGIPDEAADFVDKVNEETDEG